MLIALTSVLVRGPLVALAKLGVGAAAAALREGVVLTPKSIRTGRGTYRAFRAAGGWRVVRNGTIWKPF